MSRSGFQMRPSWRAHGHCWSWRAPAVPQAAQHHPTGCSSSGPCAPAPVPGARQGAYRLP
eukprot:9290575-Alexandrium_andersonii.AAC.1